MRYLLYSFLIGTILISCTSGDSISGDLVGVVESRTMLGDIAAEEYQDSWLPVANRKTLLNDLFEKIKNKQFEVFEFMPGELIKMKDADLEYIFHHVDTEFVENENGELYPMPIEENYDPSGVVYLKFKEELYYNDANGKFDKKVKYVCPMETMYNEDGTIRGYRGLFWVKVD